MAIRLIRPQNDFNKGGASEQMARWGINLDSECGGSKKQCEASPIGSCSFLEIGCMAIRSQGRGGAIRNRESDDTERANRPLDK